MRLMRLWLLYRNPVILTSRAGWLMNIWMTIWLGLPKWAWLEVWIAGLECCVIAELATGQSAGRYCRTLMGRFEAWNARQL